MFGHQGRTALLILIGVTVAVIAAHLVLWIIRETDVRAGVHQ